MEDTAVVVGEEQHTVDIVEQVVELDGGNSSYHRRIAETLYSTGHASDALSYAQKAVTLDGADQRNIKLLSEILRELGDEEDS